MDDTYKMILGPVAVALFLLLIAAWWRIRVLELDIRKKKQEIVELKKAHAQEIADLQKSAGDRVAAAEQAQAEKIKALEFEIAVSNIRDGKSDIPPEDPLIL